MKREIQPAPSSAMGAVPPGTAVVFVPVEIGSGTYDRYEHKQSIIIGITQIIISVLCIVFSSVCLTVRGFDGQDHVFYGYWCGIMFMITGIFGIVAGKKKTRCQIQIFMVLCIISAVFTIVLVFRETSRALRSNMYYCDIDEVFENYKGRCGQMPQYKVIVAMSSCLAILGCLEAIVSIWGSVLCCHSGVCCCSSSPTMATPAVGYFSNTGHVIYKTQEQGGPHVSASQPISSYPQGQIPSPVYAHPGCAMPSTGIDPVFDQPPPPYTVNPAQPLWMMPPATPNPVPLAAEAPPADPFLYQTKEGAPYGC